MSHLQVVDGSGVDLTLTGQSQQIRNRLQSSESEFNCEFENDVSLFPTFTQELRQTISERGLFSENECQRFAIAVDEALLNACYHGNLEIESKFREELDDKAYYEFVNLRRREDFCRARRIHVRGFIRSDQVSITIRDDGLGFDESQLPDPTDPDHLERPYGRGILLMRTFADAVRFNDLGNEVTLVKWTE